MNAQNNFTNTISFQNLSGSTNCDNVPSTAPKNTNSGVISSVTSVKEENISEELDYNLSSSTNCSAIPKSESEATSKLVISSVTSVESENISKVSDYIEHNFDNIDFSEASDSDLNENREELNTKEIVERVSIELKKHNISQQLFAKKVLGGTQALISNLILRPKPWSKLNSRGKRTYHILNEWLESPVSERIYGLKFPDLLHSTNHDIVPSTASTTTNNIVISSVMDNKISGGSDYNEDCLDTKEIIKKLLIELKKHNISQHSFAEKVLGKTQAIFILKRPKPWNRMNTLGKQNYHIINRWLKLPESERIHHLKHSDSEEEFDTKEVTRKINSMLKKYNISQHLFAEKVLARTQATVSYLLKNPKDWKHLNPCRRETFRRMNEWLKIPEFQRIYALKCADLSSSTNCSAISKSESEATSNLVISSVTSVESENISEVSNYNEHDFDNIDFSESSDSDLNENKELNTKEIVERVSIELKKHNISQQLFAKKVLSGTAALISNLILRPKPWSKLNSRGKRTYRILNKWLKSPVSERIYRLK